MASDSISIELDKIPPSLNSYYRHGGRRTYITKEGKAFKKWVQPRVRHPGGFCYVGPVTMEVLVTVPDKRAHDLDNFLKALLDNLEGWAFTNDQYITRLVVQKQYAKGVKRTEISVSPDENGESLFTKNLR